MTQPLGPGVVTPEHDRWDEDPTGRMLRCVRIARHTPEIATFEFAADDRRALTHEPGQYVTVSAEIGGQRVSRCYTISSPSTRPYTVQITVKREADGVMSTWLHDTVFVGTQLEVSGPAGSFTTAEHPADKVLLLAGGVGITPMISMIQSIHDLADPTDVVLLHNSRAPEFVAFRDELAFLASITLSTRIIQVVSVDQGGLWQGPVGRLDAEMLREQVPDLLEREIFVCGPDSYMWHVHELLVSFGVEPARIHQESFVLEEAVEEEAGTAVEGEDQVGHTVTFARSGRSVVIGDGETVLQAATAAGVRVVTSCQNGLCGTCKIPKLSGEVTISHNGGIRQREIDAGKILACCSRPHGAVVVDV